MKIYKKRKKISVIKQHIQKITILTLALIGFLYCCNCFIDYLSTRQWFVPTKITIFNRASAESVSAGSDESNIVRENSFVRKTGEGNDTSIAPSLTGIEKEIRDTFRGEEEIALAVAKAESNLNPKAQNINKNGTKDLGIFQLNDCHGWSEKERLDWKENIRLAKELRDKSGWKNWSVFNSGVYLKFIN